LDEIYLSEGIDFGILGLNVKDTGRLRELHNLLNRELSELVENPAAEHDGEGYHFHLTIELGRFEGANPYRSYFESLANKTVDLSFQARELALFYYTGEPVQFITYKILPLSG